MKKNFTIMTLLFLVVFSLQTSFGYAETNATALMGPSKSIQRTQEPEHLQNDTGNILWDTSHGVYLNYRPSGNFSELTALLSQRGYYVDENDTGIANLDLDLYQIVVICVGSAWDSLYTYDEVIAIVDFVDNGGGLLLMGDASTAPNQNINPIAQVFGTTFINQTTISPFNLYVSRMTNHEIFANVTEIFMRQAGGISATFPSSEEAWTDSDEAVVSVSEASGHAVFLGDYNIFSNGYLARASNPVFAGNVFDWLSSKPRVWDVCLAAEIDGVEYQFNVEAGNVIRGRAIGPSPEFPAPLSGYYNPTSNTYSFTVGFRKNNSRYYLVFVSNLIALTWELYGLNSNFYDNPHVTELEYCSSISTPQNGRAP
jgi:hypothetical protein